MYNNGNLYGKGVKGNLLNTSQSDMESIDYTKWLEFEIPSNIPGAQEDNVEIISGNDTMFVIDSNKYLWAWGENQSNKLGLTKEQQVEYTGLEAIRLNVDGKQVYKVFPNLHNTFVITLTNGVYELYACGANAYGELGIGNTEAVQEKFNKVNFANPEKILNISDVFGKDYSTIILDSDGKIYFSGYTNDQNAKTIFKDTELFDKNITNFMEIFDGTYGEKFENKIVELYRCYNWNQTYWMFKDNKNIAYIYNNQLIKVSENVEKLMCRLSDIGYISRNTDGERKIYGQTYAEGHNAFGSIVPIEEFLELNSSLPFDVEEIKDVYISFESVYYLLNNGKVYFTGKAKCSGTGDITSTYARTICLQEESNLPLIESILAARNNGMSSNCVIMIGKDNKKYVTGDPKLVIRDKMLQKSWCSIATNVKKFNARTANNCLGYIDENNDLYIVGDDNSMLGINQAERKISNFTLLKNYLEGMEIYNNLDGKVKDYYFTDNALFIITNSEDNDTLYVCGTYKSTTWRAYNFLGIEVEKDALIPTKVMENVKMFATSGNQRILVTNDNKIYYFGHGNSKSLPQYNVFLPKEYIDSNLPGENVRNIFLNNNSYIIAENDNKNTLFAMGHHLLPEMVNGLGFSTDGGKFVKFDFSENVIDTVSCRTDNNQYMDNAQLILMDNGTLYGFGIKNKLGINSIDTELIATAQLIPGINNIKSIVGGNGFFIAITEDGKVYGTGSNQYGILGRWIGVDRSTPNSRYKTAFEWVECPELEI